MESFICLRTRVQYAYTHGPKTAQILPIDPGSNELTTPFRRAIYADFKPFFRSGRRPEEAGRGPIRACYHGVARGKHCHLCTPFVLG